MTLSTANSCVRVRLRRPLLVIPPLCALMACQATPLESAAGRHVVVHWDPDEFQLCGGTIPHLDATVEVMADTYGLTLPSQPSVEILWTADQSLTTNICTILSPSTASACGGALPNGVKFVVSSDVVDYHELAHTVSFSGTKLGLPSFFAEGIAGRWERGLGDRWFGKSLYLSDVTYAEVRGLLEHLRIPGDAYPTAGFLWSWLEAEHGPAAMKDFAGRVDLFSSPAKIEREFEAVFGITLEMATKASWGQPQIELSGRMSAGDSIYLYACKGEPLPFEEPIWLTPTQSEHLGWLRGTYIVIAIAPIEQNGDVLFPTATLKAP